MKVTNTNVKRASMLILTILVVASLLTYVFFNNKGKEDQIQLEALKSEFESYLVHNPVQMESLTDSNLDRPVNISREQAVEDVEYFFNSLRNQYAAYEIFGGIKTFDEIKMNIINTMVSDTINVNNLTKVIKENLQIINDAHFKFDGYTLAKRKAFYTNPMYIFSSDNGSFTFVKDDKIYYLRNVTINNVPLDLEDSLYPVLDSDGQEKYQFGIIKPIDGSITLVDFTYSLNPKDKEVEKDRTFLYQYKVEISNDLKIYHEEVINGIKVIQINRFYPQNAEEELMLSNFTNSFEGVSGNMPVIIDLRFNPGGDSSYADAWAMNTFGISTILGNYFTAYLTEQGWSESSFISQSPIKNDIPIYVLTSVVTASSAEGFSKFLRNIENVTIIGENTMGCQLVGNIKSFVLPHSQIGTSFGSALFMEKNLIPIEGIGFSPDLWTDPMTALDYTLTYIMQKHF